MPTKIRLQRKGKKRQSFLSHCNSGWSRTPGWKISGENWQLRSNDQSSYNRIKF
jgi:hypothetical protein